MISQCGQNVAFFRLLQWNLSMKDTPNKEHLCNEDTVCSPNHVELSRNQPLELETPFYTGQPVGPQRCPPLRGSTVEAADVCVCSTL